MLDHGKPAVVRLLDVVGFVLFDVGERDFLELALFGIEGCAHEGRRPAEERRRGVGCSRNEAIARDLEVDVWRNRLIGQVFNVMVDVDGVAATMQGERLDQPHTTRLGRKLDRQGVAGQLKRVADQREGGQV